MSDRILLSAACVPVLAGLSLLVVLARVPATALSSAPPGLQPSAASEAEQAAHKSWVGVVTAANTAELAATTDGRVDKVFVHTGDTVAKGDRLVQFDASENTSSVHMANAQLRERASELSRFQARSNAAQTRLSRLREGATWLSKQELDTAIAESNVAEAELQAARANLGVSSIALKQQRMRAKRQMLTAPFAGTVIALGIDSGDSVTASQIVMRILSSERQVRFAFPPGELAFSALNADSADKKAASKSGRTPRVVLQLQGGEQRVFSQVDAVRPEVDPSAELVFATAPLPSPAALPDAARWIPGAPVAVTLADQ